MAGRRSASLGPPLLRLCAPPAELAARYPDQSAEVEGFLVDLAIATTAVRRSHRLRAEDGVTRVYHYTGQGTFWALFPQNPDRRRYVSPKLLLSPTELLNDPNEGVHFFDVLIDRQNLGDLDLGELGLALAKHRAKMRSKDGLSASDPLVFVASLCIESDDLNLWRFYGAAMGVSFGVHQSQFDMTSEEGISDDWTSDKLYRVKYGDIPVGIALNHLVPALSALAQKYNCSRYLKFQTFMAKSVSDLLGTVAYLFKTTSYAAENECRLLRIQSIAGARSAGRHKTINDILRIESNVQFVHGGTHPSWVTLGPQFDISNPERGQTRAIDQMRAALPQRQPIVRLSAMKYRAPDAPPRV